MKIIRIFELLKTILYYKLLFKSIGTWSIIKNPLKIYGARRILIGDRVYIAYKTWLTVAPQTGIKDCKLEIGDGCIIGNFNNIYATQHIKLGKNVLTADKVYISDNLHSYEDINTPIMFQAIKQVNTVEIGDGTWIGENVCVIGAKIGKNCVIGANSVVTKDIPDYCVAVGAPAKVIKKYSMVMKKWEHV